MTKKILIFTVWIIIGITGTIFSTRYYKKSTTQLSTPYSGDQKIYWKEGLGQYPWKNKVGEWLYTNSATQKALFNKETLFFQYSNHENILHNSLSFYVYTGTINILLKNLDTNQSKLISLQPKDSSERDILNFSTLWSENNKSHILTAEIRTDDELAIFDYNMNINQ